MKIEDRLMDKDSVQLYNQYLSSITGLLRKLKPEDREEVIREIESHLFEHMMADQTTSSEMEKLLNAIDKIGNLSDMSDPIVADKMLLYASQSLSPMNLLTAFASNSGKSLRQFTLLGLFGVFQLLLLLFVVIAIVKLFNPSVGLYVGPHVFVLGTVDKGTVADEILGYWIIPLAAIIAFISYWSFHSLLKLIRTK